MNFHRATLWRARRTWLTGGFLLIAGCQMDNDSLLSRHMSPDRRTEAKERWDEVRGEVKLQLAEEHLAAGRLGEAEKVLEQALGMAPRNPKVFILATRLRLEQGQLALARDAVTRAATMTANDPTIEYLQGIIAERYGDLPRALQHYTSAACMAPNISAYVLAQGETLIAMDQPAEALAVIGPRIEDFDGDPAVRMLAARGAQMLGLRGPAAEHCREALRGQDDDALYAEAGLILVWAEQYEEAITLLRPLVDKDIAQRSTGQASAATPAPDAVEKSLGEPADRPVKGPAQGPVTPTVIHALVRSYLATGQWRQAQWAAKVVMCRNEKDVVGWCSYARAALMLGDLEAASGVLAALRQNQVVTAETLLLTAYVALRRGDRAGAVEAAKAALALDRDLTPARRLIESAEAGTESGKAVSSAGGETALEEP